MSYDFYDDMDFEDGDFMDDDFQDESFENEPDAMAEDDCDCENEKDDSGNDFPENFDETSGKTEGFFEKFTGKDAFYAGTILGECYETAMIEAQKRREERKIKKSDNE